VCLADRPGAPCSSRVCRVLSRLHFRSVIVLGFCCSWFADGPGFSSGRFRTRADGPPGLCGWSVFRGASLMVPLAFTNCPWHLAGLFAWLLRTVRPPGRTVSQCLAALFLGSIPPSFLSCFYVCFKESFLRLEVDP
jgi:hypothetical protein